MITRIQVRNYKSLRYVDVPMRGLNVLVGPNASGKSAFLDVLSFLHDFISEDLEYAVDKKRKGNFFDLVWGRGEKETGFEIAVEAEIPHQYRIENNPKNLARYELSIQFLDGKNVYVVAEEKCFWRQQVPSSYFQSIDNEDLITDNDLLEEPYMRKWNLHRQEKNNISIRYDIDHSKQTAGSVFEGNWIRSGFSMLMDDQYEPSFLWFKKLLKSEIQLFYLDHFAMRKECMRGSGNFLKPDGSNLPFAVDDLKRRTPERFKEWLDHIRISLPNLEDVRAFRIPETGSYFLLFKYANQPELPSWAVSDGTLRLLALTLPAYLPDAQGIYLFEEPENGIHPQAIETVMDSLKSFYDGQVLITTHSPLILSLVNPEDILCFSNHPETGTKIITGDRHPVLQEWKKNKETGLGVLFASGIFDSEWGDDEGSGGVGVR